MWWPCREQERQRRVCACSGWQGFDNASVRTITNARRVEQRNREGRTNRNMGAPSCSSKWREQLREDPVELEMREQKRKTEDAKRIRGAVHEKNKNKKLSRAQNEMGNLTHHDEQELLSVWEGRHWDDNKGGWLDPELCAKARREEVEYICCHKMYTRVSRETCLRETGRAPIKTGCAETDKGQPGQPKVRARWVTKEYKTHERP